MTTTTPVSSASRPLARVDIVLLALLTLAALGARWPHWRTVPAAHDETAQLTYALRILDGQFPLVANDAYTGPFFVYLLAGLVRAGAADPLLGRAVMLAAGVALVPLTYLWLRALADSRAACVIAAGVVAANPHLIILNSHIGGATFLMPFFTTAFLWLMTCAVVRDGPGWWAAAGVAGGLALHANLAAAVPLVGGWAWFAFSVRRSPRLGRAWPAWPLLGGLVLLAVFSPVIVYNLTTQTTSADVLGQRTYLWEAQPTAATYLRNLGRLGLQLVRQTGGVLAGDESFATVAGWPLAQAAWAAAGLWAMPRRLKTLAAAWLAPYCLAIPAVSAHYGLLEPVRFTTYMTPVLAAGMGLAAARVLAAVAAHTRAEGRRWATAAAAGAIAVLILQPLVALYRYYASLGPANLNGQVILDLSNQMVAANRGEPVYQGYSDVMLGIAGVPYVPQASLALAGIPNEFLPPDQIVGRLFERPGPAMLLLHDEDAARIREFAKLIDWPGPANQKAHLLGYGLYTLDVSVPLRKPGFVWTGEAARGLAPETSVGLGLGAGLELIGYDLPEARPGLPWVPRLYWRIVEPMPPGDYIVFIHLLDADGQNLVGQSDHALGHNRYPVGAWQTGEVVADDHALALPADLPPGRYTLRAGVYTWPSLERLPVSTGHPDRLLDFGPVVVVEAP